MVSGALIRTLAVLLLSVQPAPATTESWPALHDVVGVQSNDVLNIRAAPDAAAEIIGSFASDAIDIEVIRPNESFEWGLVNLGDRTGWASLRYLVPQPGQWWGQIPAITRCFGTEPFWSLTFNNDSIEFSRPEESDIRMDTAYYVGSQNNRDRFFMSGSNIARGITVAIRTEACSDGMSDRAYGISADLVLEDAFDATLFSGCCTIQPPAR